MELLVRDEPVYNVIRIKFLRAAKVHLFNGLVKFIKSHGVLKQKVIRIKEQIVLFCTKITFKSQTKANDGLEQQI